MNLVATGQQQALVIPINYLDDARDNPTSQQLDNRYFGTNNSLSDYWNETSYGRALLTGTTTEWMTLNINSNCSFYTNYDAAIEAAVANQVKLDDINRIFLVMPNPPSGCGFAGIATIGCSVPVTDSDGTTRKVSAHLNMANYMSSAKNGAGLAAHEAGHNLGLSHANAEDYSNASLGDIGSENTPIEYGDMFDAMGGNGALVPAHYNSIHKMAVGWLTEGEYIVTQTGTHVIQPMSTPLTGPKALRIFRGLAQAPYISDNLQDVKEYLWVETRTNAGYDTNIDSQVYGGALVHLQRTLLGTPYVPLLESALIDTSPQSTTETSNNEDFLDAAIPPGGSFYDPFGGITIKHLGTDNLGNITVQVTIDADKQDSDEDGLLDTVELSRGTDPNAEDSDSDGYTDWQETCYDGDCSTYQPYPNGGDLDAMVADTDGDGLLDGEDITARTDPLTPDTDMDGINDSTDSEPLNIFLPNPEGLILSNNSRFTQPSTSFTSSDTLNVIIWSNRVGASANPATFEVTGENNKLSSSLTDLGNGSYTGQVNLSQLGYVGTDVLLSAHIKNSKIKYEPNQVISISGIGKVPEVTITSPANGLSFDSGSAITFSGTANDEEDGELTASITWSSNLDGIIGTGTNFTTNLLSDGDHSIMAESMDSDGNTGRNEINIEVGLPPINLTVTRTTNIYESTATLSWSGNVTNKSDIYRNGTVIAKVTNKGNGTTTFTEKISAKSNYNYMVCEANMQICSAEITTPE
jgi:M6 family metalloprotease-like protein